MIALWNFLKKHGRALLIGLLCVVGVGITMFAVAGVPLIINWAFSVPAWCEWFAVDWDVQDALSYYGDALGFIGTVIFSGLALWQNHVIKTESDKHTDLLEQMEKKKNMPILYFGSTGYGGICGELRMYVENISDNIATDVEISPISILNENGSVFWSNQEATRIAHLKEPKNLPLKNPSLTSIKQVFSFHVSYHDKFGEFHNCIVEGKQMGEKISFPRFFVKEIGEKS